MIKYINASIHDFAIEFEAAIQHMNKPGSGLLKNLCNLILSGAFQEPLLDTFHRFATRYSDAYLADYLKSFTHFIHLYPIEAKAIKEDVLSIAMPLSESTKYAIKFVASDAVEAFNKLQ